MSNQTFSSFLKVYRPVNILMDEVKKRDYLFRTIKKDQKWKGGAYKIPLNTNKASSIKFGALTATSAIHEAGTTMGTESSYIEIYQSLKFNHLDLDLGDNYEGSYIKVLKDTIEPAAILYKELISNTILNGSRIDVLLTDGQAGGTCTVANPERFEIGQLVILRNSDPAAGAFYVTAIDMNAGTLTFSATRGGSAANISAYTTAKSSAIYFDNTVNTSTGAFQNSVNDLRSTILSAAAGGGSTIHGLTKASYKQLQAHNKSLSASTAESLCEDIFKMVIETQKKGRGMANEVLVSYDNYAHIVASIETNRRFTVADSSFGYGFQSMSIRGIGGVLKITALREMDNDIVFAIDWNAMKLAGYKWFVNETMEKTGSPFFVERERSAGVGYEYIQDIKFYGNVVYYFLSYLAAGHSISIS